MDDPFHFSLASAADKIEREGVMYNDTSCMSIWHGELISLWTRQNKNGRIVFCVGGGMPLT